MTLVNSPDCLIDPAAVAFIGRKFCGTMEKDELIRLEDRCIQEQPPNCAAACPVHVDVRAMMAQAAVGNFTEAAKILKKTVPFPGIISRVCDQPCRSVCKRKEAGEPLSVVSIEKSCLDYASELPEKIAVLPGKEKRVWQEKDSRWWYSRRDRSLGEACGISRKRNYPGRCLQRTCTFWSESASRFG